LVFWDSFPPWGVFWLFCQEKRQEEILKRQGGWGDLRRRGEREKSERERKEKYRKWEKDK
jgi:hypothetical protein